ncbi:hypothetical protein MTR67_012064 [Solanum verrucosum]|uniref:Chromo domain-containing protein n=1 Tax=Solanum verrucosum TaxID=315347 RepID=A0AAF0QF18_SOLVR|nr:hypothetical protein MTR67_012064 [Solanum verrucosum]
MAYELELLQDLAAVHPDFHISLLKKCVGDPASVVPLEIVAVKDSLSYEDVPIEILDRQVRRLRNKEVASVKVWWRSQSVEGATWEEEVAVKANLRIMFLQFGIAFSAYCMFWELSSVRNSVTVFSGRSNHNRAGGSWFTTVTSPQTQLKKLSKSRPTDRPMVRRSYQGPWSVPVDQDSFNQPLTRTTVDQHIPLFNARSVGRSCESAAN